MELLSLRPATAAGLALLRPAMAVGLALLRPVTEVVLLRPVTGAGLLRLLGAAPCERPSSEDEIHQCLPAGEEVPWARLPSASPCCQRGLRVRTRRTFSPSATVAAEAALVGRALLGAADHAEVHLGSMGAVAGEQIGCEECLAAGRQGAADHAGVHEGSMEAVAGEQIGCEEPLAAAGRLGAANHAEVREGSMGAVVGEQIGCEEPLAAGRLGAGQVAAACVDP